MKVRTGKKDIFHYGIRFFALILTIAFYLLAIIYHQQLYENGSALSVRLSRSFPAEARVREILELEKEQEQPADACFYESLGYQQIQTEQGNASCNVEAVMLLGQASLYDRQITGFHEEDTQGCVLGGQTAWDLFGSRQVVGGRILWQEQVYVVRQVLEGKGDFFLVHPTEELSFHSLLLRAGSGSRQNLVRNFLMRYGLSGEMAEAQLLKILARGFLFLLPFLMGVAFLRLLWKVQESSDRGGREKLFCIAGTIVFLLAAAYCIRKSVSLSRDWIPGKWSDFAFWSAKWKELTNGLRYFLRGQKSFCQAEQVIYFGKLAVCSVLSCVCFEKFTGDKSGR